MDNGEVIPGLNEPWTFMGAQIFEWSSGLMMAMMASELFFSNLGKNMPFFVAILIGVPITLAGIRKTYPDEERGVRNALMDAMGTSPPGLPQSARLQPLWSGGPLRYLGKTCQFDQLGLQEMLDYSDDKNAAAGEQES